MFRSENRRGDLGAPKGVSMGELRSAVEEALADFRTCTFMASGVTDPSVASRKSQESGRVLEKPLL